MTGKIYSPFGPTIGEWQMPDDIITEMNHDCVRVTNEHNIKEYDYSHQLVGQIKLQARLSDEIINKHKHWFLARTDDFIKTLKTEPFKVQVQDAWYNRMMHHTEHNPDHVHPKAIFTSVGYLMLPDNFKEVLSHPLPDGIHGGLQLKYGEYFNFSTSMITFIPNVGTLYIFPAMVRHAVSPMPSIMEGERRSFSINFEMADEQD